MTDTLTNLTRHVVWNDERRRYELDAEHLAQLDPPFRTIPQQIVISDNPREAIFIINREGIDNDDAVS